jgi:DNA polymerase-3 subunit epsilon
MLGYSFQHHDALADAKAAAHILLSAISETGMDLEKWRTRAQQPIDLSGSIARGGDPHGPLRGEVLVFTGALEMPRREAADMAAAAGCEVAAGVTKNTTILVVGNQDVRNLNGHEKSAKHRKADELIAKGYPIRILKEDDFRELVLVSSVA